MKSALCCRCHRAPRKPGQGYCAECYKVYQREWAREHRGYTKFLPIKPHCDPGEKFCGQCQRILPIERFSRDKNRKDGRMSCCKECDYIKQLRYLDKNRAKIRVQRRESARQFRASNPGYNARACQKAKRRRLEKKLPTLI